MKAVRIHAYGDRSVLKYEDTPKPEIASDEALVRIVAASVNPVDWKVREGYLKAMIPHAFPLTLGWDFSGIIEAIGAEASGFAVGDAVFCKPDIRRNGAYAEYIAVKTNELAAKPKTISHIEAASIPLAGITAWESLVRVGELSTGQTALIHGGSGGVGAFAIQIAKARGARVVATTSTPNVALVRSLGADDVIDYRKVNFADVVRDVDVVFDTLGGEVQSASWSTLRPGGILVSIVGAPPEDRALAVGARGSAVFIGSNPPALQSLAELVEAGKLRVVIGGEFALRDIPAAHALSESGRTVGKIAIYVGEP